MDLIKKIIEKGKELNALINPYILEVVLYKTNGKCPCRPFIDCPCDCKEYFEKGKCYCGLFVKK